MKDNQIQPAAAAAVTKYNLDIDTGCKELDKHLKAIAKTLEREASARLEQAYRISVIDQEELYREAGYTTITDCFNDVFCSSISEKTVQALSRIGRSCLTMDKTGHVRSIIAHEFVDESGKMHTEDYTYTVLNQIISLGADKLIEYDAAGKIFPGMTLKQAKEFMISLKQIGMEEEEAEPGEEGSGSEGEAGSADYQKRLDKVKKALNKLTSEYSLSKEDASYLIAVINDNTIFGRNEE